jgi:hypothetical protein
MGGGETYGSNSRGDYFPEAELTVKNPTYGYKSFEVNAKVYMHHINKDPEKSYGDVIRSGWNDKMHRVELLLELINARLPEVIQAINSGNPISVSMGTRVPYDICSVCFNKAKSRAQYCEHLMYKMNEVLPDGRKVYAINKYPKFFDISIVKRPADITARQLMKVASSEKMSSAEIGELTYGADKERNYNVDDILKAAGIKSADIDKNVEPQWPNSALLNIVDKIGPDMKQLQDYEPEIPRRMMDSLMGYETPKILSTLSSLGIMLKPREFQRIILVKSNRGRLADELDSKNVIFNPSTYSTDRVLTGTDSQISHGHFEPGICDVIKDLLPHRSMHFSHFFPRIGRFVDDYPEIVIRISAMKKPNMIEKSAENSSPALAGILASLGAGYLLYRNRLPMEAKELEKILVRKPYLAPLLVGGIVTSLTIGKAIAGAGPTAEAAGQIAGAEALVTQLDKDRYGVKIAGAVGNVVKKVGFPLGASYVWSTHARRKELEGRHLNFLDKMFRDYPGLASIGGVLATTKYL